MDCILTDFNLVDLSAVHSYECSDICVAFLLCDV
jgi:hypothetical protein